jgi:hypothetical protein
MGELVRLAVVDTQRPEVVEVAAGRVRRARDRVHPLLRLERDELAGGVPGRPADVTVRQLGVVAGDALSAIGARNASAKSVAGTPDVR